VSFAAITLCVASQRVFIAAAVIVVVIVVYFVMDSVLKLLDTPS
jgi:lipopolysaccharide export LptBFGC system permease protein LptF